MTKFDEQMANIEAMLQQILKNTGESESKDDYEDEDEGRCPTCGHMGEGGPKGKMLIVMSKKKGKPGDMPEMPAVMKDILKALSQR